MKNLVQEKILPNLVYNQNFKLKKYKYYKISFSIIITILNIFEKSFEEKN